MKRTASSRDDISDEIGCLENANAPIQSHRQSSKRNLIVAIVVLYVGLALGLPVLARSLYQGDSAGHFGAIQGAVLILVATIVSLVIVGKTAANVGARPLHHIILALLIWPMGPIASIAILWGVSRGGLRTKRPN